MERHFEKELKRIRTALEKMARLSQEMLESSTHAYLNRDRSLAEKAFANEREVNNLEIEIDQMVEGAFALHQPVAVDLRFLLAILKINNDLERAGDHCVNIAQSAITCGVGPDGLPNLALPQMITLANSMFRDASADAKVSASSAPTTRRQTALACVTTSMCRTWPRHTCWLWTTSPVAGSRRH
jgi:phosphate transport system protein